MLEFWDDIDHRCEKCNLHNKVRTPFMPVRGSGKKQILIVTEEPTVVDDRLGLPLSGTAGQRIQQDLEMMGYDLNEDFYSTTAIRCIRTSTKSDISDTLLNNCRHKLEETIKEIKPIAIFAFGSNAVKTLFKDILTHTTSISSLSGTMIPHREYNTWVFPLLSPEFLLAKKWEKNRQACFKRELRNALQKCKDLPVIPRMSTYDNVKVLLSSIKVIKTLRHLLKTKPLTAFDYETSGTKPYRNGHTIYSLAISTKNISYSFELKLNSKNKHDRQVVQLVKQYLSDKKMKKICHNAQFEYIWSTVLLCTPKGIIWCTMITQHMIDNRPKICSLKHQIAVRWGIYGYDKSVDPYIKSIDDKDPHSLNRMSEVPIPELLLYCGTDAYWTMQLYLQQKKEVPLRMKLARKFFHMGALLFARMSLTGIRVNVSYYNKENAKLQTQITELEEEINESQEIAKYNRIYGKAFSSTSPPDLGKLFYDVLKIKVQKQTTGGGRSTDEDALSRINHWIARSIIKKRKLNKLADYIKQILREEVNGRIHTSLTLHIARTFRSCIAGYEKVLVVRDFEQHPEGVAIKDIKVGDLVYCFDDNLNPQIKPVVWQGKTGHKEIIRVHYYRKNKKGHFDCTPEHKIRLINGDYVQAQNLLKKTYYKRKTKNEGKCRVLACSRTKDKLNFTGHIFNGKGKHEHRFIYTQLIGTLLDTDVVHHKNTRHLDHTHSNLEKHTKSSHSKLHAVHTICSKKSRANNLRVMHDKIKKGTHPFQKIRNSEDAYNYLNLTKKECLSILHSCAGQPSKAAKAHKIDFTAFKRYLKKHNIVWEKIRLVYDKNNMFISKRRLMSLSKLGRKKVSTILGHNHYKLLKLYTYYGLDVKRKWKNQYGNFKPGNHIITKIEWLHTKEDVYDIEVQDSSNFFVNEICVHNSSLGPNTQNWPNRIPESMKIIRGGIIPSPGRCILEPDFGGAEVVTAAAYNKDPNLIAYLENPNADMHRDMACDLYKAEPGWITSLIRKCVKSATFGFFYGSFFKQVAQNMFEVNFTNPFNDGTTVGKHLKKLGMGTLAKFEKHIQKVEKIFWYERFNVYRQWKDKINEEYRDKGEIWTFLGFRFIGYMDEKQVSNYPIQGTSFHLLLYSLLILERKMLKAKLKTDICLEVHDSGVFDVPANENAQIVKMFKNVTAGLKTKFDWLSVSMKADADISEVDGNFSEMKKYK